MFGIMFFDPETRLVMEKRVLDIRLSTELFHCIRGVSSV